MSEPLLDVANSYFDGEYNKWPLEVMTPILRTLDGHDIAKTFKNTQIYTNRSNEFVVSLVGDSLSIEMTFRCRGGQPPLFSGFIYNDKTPTIFSDLDPNDENDVQGWVNEVVGKVQEHRKKNTVMFLQMAKAIAEPVTNLGTVTFAKDDIDAMLNINEMISKMLKD